MDINSLNFPLSDKDKKDILYEISQVQTIRDFDNIIDYLYKNNYWLYRKRDDVFLLIPYIASGKGLPYHYWEGYRGLSSYDKGVYKGIVGDDAYIYYHKNTSNPKNHDGLIRLRTCYRYLYIDTALS